MAITDNLISYWPLDEASGTRSDSHGSNNLADNNTVTSQTGKVSDAAEFVSANSEYLSIADNTDLRLNATDAAIALWVRFDSIAADQILLSKWETGTQIEYGVQYRSGDNKFRAVCGNGTSAFVQLANTFGTLATGTWYFVQMQFDNTAKTMSIAVNDGAFDSASFTGTIKDGTTEFNIGRRSFTTPNHFDGRIDEVGIWKRKLTAAEWTWLYNSGSGRAYSEFAPTANRRRRTLICS